MTNNTPTTAVTRRFDRAAEYYHREASAQREIARALARNIPASCSPSTVVDLGCGTGFLTADIAARFPRAFIVGVDASPKMLACWSAFLTPYGGRFEAQCCDIHAVQFEPGSIDLVVSSAALQWISPLRELAARIHSWLRPAGRVHLAVLVAGTLRELHLARQAATGEPYDAWLPEADEVCRELEQGGLMLQSRAESEVRDVFSSGEQALRSISQLGFTAHLRSNARRPLTRKQLATVAAHLNAAANRGNISLSYRVLTVEAVPSKTHQMLR